MGDWVVGCWLIYRIDGRLIDRMTDIHAPFAHTHPPT